ncbi:hypothetical protein BKK52_03240 [Rodentibacter trehalosifermentans]|uniref:Uncharacterized protein n=1 Tax=Rodentibacter trehalosifermentans TaxID=1908263 RepID=A0A1V3J3I1_9PAST|nr:hypothetical protein [Rodentibacter trehalosifermentans]OOF49541.1 hypothetical protein BKK52_03240 [Rodentibacter trehalosifermentans]
MFNRKNEGIFQLSLTEIAFMLIFILLFLLGSMYFNLVKENQELLQINDQQKELLIDYEGSKQVIAESIKVLQLQTSDPNEIISQLKAMLETNQEIQKLRENLQGQEALLSSLSEILGKDLSREELADKIAEISAFNESILLAAKDAGVDHTDLNAVQNYLTQSVKLNHTIENMLASIPDISEQEREKLIHNLVSKLNDTNTKENINLQGQVAYLRKRLEAQGGRDLPPCWANAEGAVEYLFKMDIFSSGIKITPIWESHRAEDAKQIPNIEKLSNKILTRAYFQQLTSPIRTLTDEMQCRHYVKIKNHVSDLRTFNNYRYAIEHVFYKLELR